MRNLLCLDRAMSISVLARLFCALLILLTSISQSWAISLLRDEEIESTLKDYARPVFEEAGLGPNAVRMFLVNDQSINAFVAGGANMFLNAGLIMRTTKPEQLISVIAHETGHITGGHLSRTVVASDRAFAKVAVATALGLAAALVGAPQVATALLLGGQHVAFAGLLRFSRTQEQAADQAAISIMRRLGYPLQGMEEMFEILQRRNLGRSSSSVDYLQSHPLTSDRIRAVRSQIGQQTTPDQITDTMRKRHDAMVAKLRGFLGNPRQVMRETAGKSDENSRYARTIAMYKNARLDDALREVRALTELDARNPYYHELEGQMLFESGRTNQSIAPFRKALELKPTSSLFRIQLAHPLLEANKAETNREALTLLESAIGDEKNSPFAWRLMALAQSRNNLLADSHLSLVEFGLLSRDRELAEREMRRARKIIDANHPSWLHLQDLEIALNQ